MFEILSIDLFVHVDKRNTSRPPSGFHRCGRVDVLVLFSSQQNETAWRRGVSSPRITTGSRTHGFHGDREQQQSTIVEKERRSCESLEWRCKFASSGSISQTRAVRLVVWAIQTHETKVI